MARNGKRLGFLPGWRIFSYAILIFNLLMLIWVIAGIASGSGHATDCGTLDQQTCDNAAHVGTGIGVAILIVFWALLDVILGVLWLVTNRSKSRSCPVCGRDVKKGLVQCGNCGYDFRAQLQQPAGYAPPTPGGYPPPPQPPASHRG
jgi:hypothetical protein